MLNHPTHGLVDSNSNRYAQANTNNVNKTWTLLQITGGKNEHSIKSIVYVFSV